MSGIGDVAAAPRGGRTWRSTDTAGFTLIEMLVVLAIAVLIGGIGFPRLQGQIIAQEFRTGVSAVTALLRMARADAIRADRPVVVAPSAAGLVRDGGPPLVLPASITVTAAPIVFFGDGSTNGGGMTVSGRGRAARISVAPATGLLQVRAG